MDITNIMKRAIYAGTFDPITNGHLDVLKRARLMFDEVIIAVATNDSKTPLFNTQERLQLIRENVRDCTGITVELLEGLTVDFARSRNAIAVVRGLRAVSDFEYEFQMAQMNRHLAPDIETIFLMPSQAYFYTSSHLVKQVAHFDSSRIGQFVPPNVMAALKNKSRTITH